MRPSLFTTLLTAACVTMAPTTWAAPLLTVQYQIDGLSRTLQFMDDLSVVACDGSVLVACDGSVVPVPGASFRTVGDGSVRELSPLLLLGDGSVRLGTELPTEMDGILLSALTFSPNPLLSGAFSVLDFGASSIFVFSLSGPLALGSNAFSFELEGSATLNDAEGDGVSAGELSLFGQDGLVVGAVDAVGFAALGSGGLNGEGVHPLGTATGTASCVACAVQTLAIGFEGSGGGDTYAFTAQLDIEKLTAVPEPGILALLGIGLAGLACRARNSPIRRSIV